MEDVGMASVAGAVLPAVLGSAVLGPAVLGSPVLGSSLLHPTAASSAASSAAVSGWKVVRVLLIVRQESPTGRFWQVFPRNRITPLCHRGGMHPPIVLGRTRCPVFPGTLRGSYWPCPTEGPRVLPGSEGRNHTHVACL